MKAQNKMEQKAASGGIHREHSVQVQWREKRRENQRRGQFTSLTDLNYSTTCIIRNINNQGPKAYEEEMKGIQRVWYQIYDGFQVMAGKPNESFQQEFDDLRPKIQNSLSLGMCIWKHHLKETVKITKLHELSKGRA